MFYETLRHPQAFARLKHPNWLLSRLDLRISIGRWFGSWIYHVAILKNANTILAKYQQQYLYQYFWICRIINLKILYNMRDTRIGIF